MMNLSLSRLLLATALAAASMLCFPEVSRARSSFVSNVASMYPTATRLHNCGLCHNKYTGFASVNPYGQDFSNASGNVNQKLATVESVDSDGDSTSNLMEIMTGAGFMPGFTCDTFQNLDNAPANIADLVDPQNIGCPATTTTSVAATTSTVPSTTSTTLLEPCHQAAKSVLMLKRKPGKPDKDKLVWKWNKGDETLPEHFGMPMTSTAYSLSVADPAGVVVELTIQSSDLYWSAKKGVFKYVDKAGTSSGVIAAKLKAAAAGKAQASVKGKGVGLALPALGLSPPVSVTLLNSLGECWVAGYATAKKNEVDTFKAITK